MFKGLEIENFESHKDTQIDFDNGVNAIIGTSDSGKSSIRRAIEWAIHNRPQGFGFKS